MLMRGLACDAELNPRTEDATSNAVDPYAEIFGRRAMDMNIKAFPPPRVGMRAAAGAPRLRDQRLRD
jgi:hypothetical protein